MLKTLSKKIWTDKQLMALPKDKGKYELIDGELTIMSPAGRDHGGIGARIIGILYAYMRTRKLGMILDSSTGFRLDQDNVLSPDVGFIRIERLRQESGNPEGFVAGAPDLAVEVISPSERSGMIRKKLEKYFERGVQQVWLVYPKRKTVEVFTSPGTKVIMTAGEEIDCGDFLPGFRLPVVEIFESWF